MALRHRLHVRVIAAFLMALVCGGAVNWGHTAWDDPTCDPFPVQHDHSAHRIGGAAETPAPADHCTLCHFFRLLQIALSAESAAADVDAGDNASRPRNRSLHPTVLAFNVPSRAPPVALS
jgi:hypothetical protein